MRSSQILILMSFLFSPLAIALDYFGQTNLTNIKTDVLKITGAANLNQVTSEMVNVIGSLKYEGIQVNQQLKVIGPITEGIHGNINELHCVGWATLKDNKINTLIVTGHLDAEKIEVIDQSNITGVMDASNSKFKDISIISSIMTLKNSSAESIHFQKNNVEKEPPVLKLLESSIVTGDIIFKSQNGKVIIDQTSKVMGQVKGGIIENQGTPPSPNEGGMKTQ